MKVAICINTFGRPDQLREVLHGLAGLRFEGEQPVIDVIIVNNDPRTSIDGVLAEVRAGFPWGLHGLVEPRRGIPQARNCAVRQAQVLGADVYAFIDDDEYPEPDWLELLLDCSRREEAQLVQGRVVPRFLAPPPVWAAEGGFFDGGRDEAELERGQILNYAATNNLLVRSDVIATIGGFDEWWSTQGGDDTEFTLRASRFGFVIAWCPDAVVTEGIPPGRMTVRWVLRRGFRSGNTYGLICRRGSGSGRGRLLLLACSVVVLITALLKTPFWTGRIQAIRRLRDLMFAVGNLAGAVGFKYLEYNRPFVSRHFAPATPPVAGGG